MPEEYINGMIDVSDIWLDTLFIPLGRTMLTFMQIQELNYEACKKLGEG